MRQSPSRSTRIRRIARKPSAAAKKPKARSFFERLSRERSAFKKSLNEISAMRDGATAGERKRAFLNFHDSLVRHWASVEQTLHATLLTETTSARVHEEVLLEREIRHLTELLANELIQIPTADPRWNVKYAIFSDLLKRHLRKSTETSFRVWRKELGPAETAILGARYSRLQTKNKKKEARELSFH